MTPTKCTCIQSEIKAKLITNPIFLLGLQLSDAFQEALFGAVEVIGQAGDGDFIRLLVRSRHLNINLEEDQRSR